jgi:hypothetical protein
VEVNKPPNTTIANGWRILLPAPLAIANGNNPKVPRPRSVILPMPLEVKERYLEIREAGSDAL